MATKLKVETGRYEFSHGKKPRGYGCWAYNELSGTTERDWIVYFFTGTITDLKKNVRKNGPGDVIAIRILP